MRVTGVLPGDGYAIEKIAFESRLDLLVTANIYLPSDVAATMPGILICHSHHYPKSEHELQTMGMTWARQGLTVMVMDQLCHGERAQHPFRKSGDFEGPFRIKRQDYFFRHNAGMQLDLIGESLMGWMVGDLMRGVDVLIGRPCVDPSRIFLIGSVAGGGDVAAIAGALDERIAAVIPFSFGKGQMDPNTMRVNYAGHGSWESTRNLRLSARDGFEPWMILGAIAPRRLVYGHEFAWDARHDPVWARLKTIYNLYNVPDRLAAVHGSGSVRGRSRLDTHCNNVGTVHRRQIYAILEEWFGIPAPEEECEHQYAEEELLSLNPEFADLRPRPVHRLAKELGAARSTSARRQLSGLEPGPRRDQLRHDFGRLLGDVHQASRFTMKQVLEEKVGEVEMAETILEVESGITVPVVLLVPSCERIPRCPVVVGLAQEGKQRLLASRAELIAEILRGGVAVCLPDLRGTGDTERGEEQRGRRSLATAVSSAELMLGQTLLGSRLRDLRTVLGYLRTRSELDTTRLGLWGDSLAPHNSARRELAVPFDADPFPELSEPLGGLLALLAALFEPEVRVVYLSGGLIGYASLLDSPFCYVPYDVMVPGVLTVGDLCDVAAAIAPRPLRMEALVNGLNRRVSPEVLLETFEPARAAYDAAGAAGKLRMEIGRSPSAEVASWIITQLRSTPSG